MRELWTRRRSRSPRVALFSLRRRTNTFPNSPAFARALTRQQNPLSRTTKNGLTLRTTGPTPKAPSFGVPAPTPIAQGTKPPTRDAGATQHPQSQSERRITLGTPLSQRARPLHNPASVDQHEPLSWHVTHDRHLFMDTSSARHDVVTTLESAQEDWETLLYFFCFFELHPVSLCFQETHF